MEGGSLVIVSGDFDLEAARVMAVHAVDVLEGRHEVDSLRAAIEGCGVVVGTTARSGAYRVRSEDIREVAEHLAAERAEREEAGLGLPAAIVFGSEDSGLHNDEIALCHRLAFIPTGTAYTSLNLAQAVMVCLYEFHRAYVSCLGRRQEVGARERRGHPPAEAGAVADMLMGLEDALLRIGFLSEDNPAHVMMSIRSLIARSGLDERELRILRGIVRQMTWFSEGGHEVVRAKRERGEKLK
jgi:tRNA/rRNA methyltransferase